MDREEALRILELTEGATNKQIKSAYRRLARIHHPDKHVTASSAEKASHEEIIKGLNEAKDTLLNQRPTVSSTSSRSTASARANPAGPAASSPNPAGPAQTAPSSSNPAGPAQTVSGGVGPAAPADKLTAEKEKIVNEANALVEQSHKEWQKNSRMMDKKSYNGNTLADDMLKNWLLIRDLMVYFKSKKLKSKHEKISQEAQALNPKNPGEFAKNVGGVSARLDKAQKEYKKMQEDKNFQQNASYYERIMRYISPDPKKEEQKKARQDTTQEPSQGPRRP